jgi:hypothetical protein
VYLRVTSLAALSTGEVIANPKQTEARTSSSASGYSLVTFTRPVGTSISTSVTPVSLLSSAVRDWEQCPQDIPVTV